MKFVHGIIIAVGLLVSVNLALISADLEAGNVPDYTKKAATLDMKMPDISGTTASMSGDGSMKTPSATEEKPGIDSPRIPVVNPSVLITEDAVGGPLVVEIEFFGAGVDIVDHVNYDVRATQGGVEIISDLAAHRHPGKYPVHTSVSDLTGDEIEFEIVVQGIGHGEDIVEPIGQSTSAVIAPSVTKEEPATKPPGIPVVNPSVLITEDAVGGPLVVEIEFFGAGVDIVDHVNYDVRATQGGVEIISDLAAHRHPGKYPVHTSVSDLTGDEIEFEIVVQGIGHGEDIVEPIGQSTSAVIAPSAAPEPETGPEMAPSEPSAPAEPVLPEMGEPGMESTGGASAKQVMMAIGSSLPGCEATNECYIPHTVTIAVGETVTWINDDAGHTATSGDVDMDPDSTGTALPGGFDSGFLLSGDSYSHTFEEAGEYPYFCIVHPWMKGMVIVQ